MELTKNEKELYERMSAGKPVTYLMTKEGLLKFLLDKLAEDEDKELMEFAENKLRVWTDNYDYLLPDFGWIDISTSTDGMSGGMSALVQYIIVQEEKVYKLDLLSINTDSNDVHSFSMLGKLLGKILFYGELMLGEYQTMLLSDKTEIISNLKSSGVTFEDVLLWFEIVANSNSLPEVVGREETALECLTSPVAILKVLNMWHIEPQLLNLLEMVRNDNKEWFVKELKDVEDVVIFNSFFK